MSHSLKYTVSLLLSTIALVLGQQQCYFGPGAANRGPSNLVPCLGSGQSACCLLGDTCLSGNTCYNYATGDLYQYGCTDITYTDESCPYKCGWNTTLSPWIALEYCQDANVNDTWVCHSPESCGCEWESNPELLILEPRGCKEMGSNARLALLAPSTLAPFVSLPSTIGGSTGYYSGTTISNTSTWVSTAVSGYTPSHITPLTTYSPLVTSIILINSNGVPSASTVAAAHGASATATATSSQTPTDSASATSTPSSTGDSSSGLSTGAEIGIGVGVAGGVCLIAAVVIASLCWRRRRPAKASSAPEQPQPHQTPQMQNAYFDSQPPMWKGTYSPHASPAPPYNHMYSPPLMYLDPEQAKPQVSPPVELNAEREIHEIGSEVVTNSNISKNERTGV